MQLQFADINKQAIYAKLSHINTKTYKDITLYLANDIIKAISTSIYRDKHLINTYDKKLIHVLLHEGKYRRYLTLEGVKKYIHEGKIYSYENVCSYFKELPRDKQRDKNVNYINKCIVSMEPITFKTSLILKFIYGRRKKLQHLHDTCTKDDLISINISTENQIVSDRYKWLMHTIIQIIAKASNQTPTI